MLVFRALGTPNLAAYGKSKTPIWEDLYVCRKVSYKQTGTRSPPIG